MGLFKRSCLKFLRYHPMSHQNILANSGRRDILKPSGNRGFRFATRGLHIQLLAHGDGPCILDFSRYDRHGSQLGLVGLGGRVLHSWASALVVGCPYVGRVQLFTHKDLLSQSQLLLWRHSIECETCICHESSGGTRCCMHLLPAAVFGFSLAAGSHVTATQRKICVEAWGTANYQRYGSGNGETSEANQFKSYINCSMSWTSRWHATSQWTLAKPVKNWASHHKHYKLPEAFPSLILGGIVRLLLSSQSQQKESFHDEASVSQEAVSTLSILRSPVEPAFSGEDLDDVPGTELGADQLKVMSGKAMKEYEIQIPSHNCDSLIRKEGTECRFRNLAYLDCMILSYFIALTKPSPQSTCWKKTCISTLHARLMQQHMSRKPFVWEDLETVLSDLVLFSEYHVWSCMNFPYFSIIYWLQSHWALPNPPNHFPPRPRTHRDEFQKPPDKQVLI